MRLKLLAALLLACSSAALASYLAGTASTVSPNLVAEGDTTEDTSTGFAETFTGNKLGAQVSSVATSGGSVAGSFSYSDDALVVIPGSTTSNDVTTYRGDINISTASGVTVNGTTGKVIAYKFNDGKLPNGATLKFEMSVTVGDQSTTAYRTGASDKATPSGNMDTSDGGKIYYWVLTDDEDNMFSFKDTSVSISATDNVTVTKISLVVDKPTTDDAYALDWVKFFNSVDELTDNKDWDDDYVESETEITDYVVKIGSTTYTTLADALAAATSDDVIEIGKDVEYAGRYIVNNSSYQRITMQGGVDGCTVKRTNSNASQYSFGVESNNNYSLTVSNLTFTEANSMSIYYFFVKQGTLSLENVTLSGLKSTGSDKNGAMIATNTGATLNLTNVKFDNCTPGSSSGHVYAEGNVNIYGDCSGMSVYLASTGKIIYTAIDDVTPAGVITIVPVSISDGDTVVYGTTETSLFNIDNDDITLVAGDNCIVAKVVAPSDYTIYNETIMKGYSTFADAMDEVATNNELALYGNVSITSRTIPNKNITFKSGTYGDNTEVYTIYAANTNKDQFVIGNENNNSTLTFQNVDIEGDATIQRNLYTFQLKSGCALVFDNVNMKSIFSHNSNPQNGTLINCVNGSTVTLNNVTWDENCWAKTGYVEDESNGAFVYTGGTVNVSGDCSGTTYYYAGGTIACSDLTNADAMGILVTDESYVDQVIVTGTSDTTKFYSMSSDYALKGDADNNQIILVKNEGGESTALDTITAVESMVDAGYYTVDGRRVVEPAGGTLVIRVTADGKATMMIVR